MKNKLLKFLALAFTCVTLSAVATACGNGTLKPPSSSTDSSVESSVEDSSSSSESSFESVEESASEDSSSTSEEKYLTFKTLSVDGDTAYAKFPNATEEFSFAEEILSNATFIVSKDKFCEQKYVTKEVPLQEGDNVFYIFTMDGEDVVNTYTVTLRRRPIYSVFFNTQGGTEIAKQKIEEDDFATMPDVTPERTGYTFKDWNFDFTKPITGSITVKPEWTVNRYTLTILYNNGQPDEKITQDYNTAINVEEPKKAGYTFTWDKKFPRVMPAENITVTASWQLAFTLSGGSVTGLTEAGKTLREIEIPSQIDGVKITTVGDGAFSKNHNIKKVTIADGITQIGENAFYDCDELASVEIPNSVTSIGEFAFMDCYDLTSVVIPDSVTSMGYNVFAGCHKLTIYCEAESMPRGWESYWNYFNCPVVWGYTGE